MIINAFKTLSNHKKTSNNAIDLTDHSTFLSTLIINGTEHNGTQHKDTGTVIHHNDTQKSNRNLRLGSGIIYNLVLAPFEAQKLFCF